MRELLNDIFISMRSNLARIRLTGFSIAWGIFILIVLLGAGQGLLNGLNRIYGSKANATVTLTPGETTYAWNGHQKGRSIRLTEQEGLELGTYLTDWVEGAYPVKTLEGVQLSVGSSHSMRDVHGMYPGYRGTMDVHIIAGRDLDWLDMEKERKVCVISRTTARSLFRRERPEGIIGRKLQVGGRPFTVVGVYEPDKGFMIVNDVFLPMPTMTQMFMHDDQLTSVLLKMRPLEDEEENHRFDKTLKSHLAEMKDYAVQDTRAVQVRNTYNEYILVIRLMGGIQFFIWIIGLATLIAGVVGVSNIMLITVRERTREFGVLRAMGAEGNYILKLVVLEAVFISLVAGYIGMMLGMGVVKLLGVLSEVLSEGEASVFMNPNVPFPMIIAITIIIVLAGLLAGYYPAHRALGMKLIDALADTVQTLTQQKLRTVLTAFGIFWGILILTILLGVNTGMSQGFVGRAVSMEGNYIEMEPFPTTMDYKGLGPDRVWRFRNSDVEAFRQRFPDKVTRVSGLNLEDVQMVVYGTQSGLYQVMGVNTDFFNATPQRVIMGRYINELDMERKRKVCVIGDDLYNQYFAGEGDPCGKQIKVAGQFYTIVGVSMCTNRQWDEELNVSRMVQMPLTSEQVMFSRGEDIDILFVAAREEYPMLDWEPTFVSFAKELHKINPKDEEAISVYSVAQYQEEMGSAMMGITLLCWLVGIGTLLAGLIGISNIMQVTVKERTQEIGVYRALGAQPIVIIRQILSESLVLTFVAGFLGLMSGLVILTIVRHALAATANNGDMVSNPYIPFSLAVTALLILIIGGLVAGYIPVKKALQIKAIEALKAE